MVAYRIGLFVIGVLCLLVPTIYQPTRAQEQCGIAETITYPIDTSTFLLSQDFGVASPRHQGRFHTGEDWFLPNNVSIGQPIRAAATGRVTYSAPFGWGRDGGVIIIEHTFADGTIIYSQYGHIMETDTITFPQRLTCVEAGDVIAAIGDARPAPHLHFEIRVNQPDIPGPGYTRDDPVTAGWRRPAEVITNLQARLNPAYRWNVTTGIDTIPLLLDDNSLMIADGETMRRITPDGRILWRVTSDKPVAAITGYQANPLAIYTDGTIGRLDFEGSAGERWSLDFTPDMPPLTLSPADGEILVFHTTDNTLTALTPDRRDILWQLEDVPPYEHAYVADLLIVLVYDDALRVIDRNGTLVDEAVLEDGASMATLPDGSLLVYTAGGLWRVDASSEWSAALAEDAPPGGGASAVAASGDGRIFLTDGERLYAYSRQGTLDWDAGLQQPLTGRATMTHYENLLLITTTGGDILTARDGGGLCGYTRIYGGDSDLLWHDIGDDDILRVLVGDQVIGLSWQRFNGGC